jgi:hypothetical protein
MSSNQLLNLSSEDVKTLENLRSKIMPLTMSIEGLQQKLAETPEALLNWYAHLCGYFCVCLRHFQPPIPYKLLSPTGA